MKTQFRYLKLTILLGILLVLISSSVCADRINPAMKYCEELGYQYNYNISTGSEECILPNGNSVIAWKFLLGEVAQEYSYCVKNGLEIRVVNNPEICSDLGLETCAVCIFPDNKEIEVTKAMNLTLITGYCGNNFCNIGETYDTCPKDCSSGTVDGYCDKISDGICDNDCVIQQMPASDIDCPYCGDGLCKLGENYENCKADCPSGFKDSYCDSIIDGRCDSDCKIEADVDCSCGNEICEKSENKTTCQGDCKQSLWHWIKNIFKSLFG
jgi:putative hemolysin